MTRLRFLFTVSFMLFCTVHGAFGASIAIIPSGNGSFIIQGNSMDGVAGIEINLSYNTSILASPAVTQGSLASGAMLAANTNNPGSIKIAIISNNTFSGNGPVAKVSFATHKDASSITISSVRMIDIKGLPVTSGTGPTAAASGFTSSAGIPFSQTSPIAGATNPADPANRAAASASPVSTSLGTVNMPPYVEESSNNKPTHPPGEPFQFNEPAAATKFQPPEDEETVEPAEEESSTTTEEKVTAEKHVTEKQAVEKIKFISYKATLENFRAYTGEKTPAILVALFNNKIAPEIRQEPFVVVSNGKTPVKLVAKLERADEKSPNFALNGAKLVSLHKDDASFTWIIEALPNANILRASLTILTDSDIMEYPLTLVPPVEGVSPAETDFAIFLNDSGSAKPKRDLNGDGNHDYLDDYIYTAHYLILKAAADKTKK